MKHGHAIIGANLGDEGKGLMVDYLAANADLVVRFNGGAQAGHTVVTPQGQRHVFHHYGAGGFHGVPTFLSKFFIVNPLLFTQEERVSDAVVYVDPRALVTTPFDMLSNQKATHGKYESCGIGLNLTMQRSKTKAYKLTVENMCDADILNRIEDEYGRGSGWRTIYETCTAGFLKSVVITDRPPGNKVIFEGAQGLMLDQDSADFPYVTHSHTGLKNIHQLVAEMGIDVLEATYVTRSYLTRHGAGPLPDEEPLPAFVQDPTNIDNEWQGPLRYAPLNILELERRVIKDSAGLRKIDLAVTCMDQFLLKDKFVLPVGYTSYGPTRSHITPSPRAVGTLIIKPKGIK